MHLKRFCDEFLGKDWGIEGFENIGHKMRFGHKSVTV